jgi:hypothetical protein
LGGEGVSGGNTIFITGYARIPQGITANQLYKVLGIAVEVETETGEIRDADCTLATTVGKRFFRELVVGYNLEAGVEPLVRMFEDRYYGSAKKAVIAALRVVEQRYEAFKIGAPMLDDE